MFARCRLTALARLHSTLTKGNLWLYILALLTEGSSSPSEIKQNVVERFGFSPASITFYSVLYRLRREGLVRKASNSFRARYEITEKGKEGLAKGRELLSAVLERTKT